MAEVSPISAPSSPALPKLPDGKSRSAPQPAEALTTGISPAADHVIHEMQNRTFADRKSIARAGTEVGLNANELDIVHGFDAGADYLVLSSAYQSTTSVLDSGGYTWVLTSVGGANHAVAVIGSSAAIVSAQTIWL